MLLYEQWLTIANRHANEPALTDLRSGTCWTFSQLAEAGQALPPRPVYFPCGHGFEFVSSVISGWRHQRPVCPLDPDQTPPDLVDLPANIAHVKTTSGTSGQPRCIMITAAQLKADARNIVSTMGLRGDWPNLGVISLAHSYGFSNLVLPLLLHGVPLCLVDGALPESLRRAASTGLMWTLPAVPALWKAWHEAGTLPETIRLAISAGAPLPLSLEHDIFDQHGLKVHNFYGASECGGIAYDRSSTPRSNAALAGEPMEGVAVAVESDGCLVVRGGAVAEGYWPGQEDSLRAGQFRTEDLGDLREGNVYLRGRASDRINVAGRKLAPEAVERALLEYPGVTSCLVFGVPESGTGAGRSEEVIACVEVEAGVAEEQLRGHLLVRLPAWQIPRRWWLVEALSVNQRGKLSRAEWRRRFLASH